MRSTDLMSKLADRVLHLPPARSREIDVERDIAIPMDDGVALLADRYWATGRSGDPLVLMRSPYGRGAVSRTVARAYAERGAQVLLISCRGTFGSGGEWMPMRDDVPDGRATVDWIRKQPWFGGTMILAGPSYLGYTQWAVATQMPGVVTAMVPHVTSSRLALPFIRPDALDWDLLVRWNHTTERQEERTAGLRGLLRLDERRLRKAMATLPKESVDTHLSGHQWQFFQDCLHFDSEHPHWSQMDHSAKVSEVAAPASFVGGWYDIMLQDQLRDHAAKLTSAAPQRLTIGPWVHGAIAGIGAAVAEGIYFGLPFATGGRPADRAPVRLYVMGTKDRGSPVPGIAVTPPAPWRDFDRWPPEGYAPTSMHLRPGGRLTSAGSVADSDRAAVQQQSSFSRFRYDPQDPTPSFGGPFLAVGAGPRDNRALEARPDVLVLSTDPLTDDIEVIGEVSATIWFSSSRSFTDVFVRLCDVDEKGRSTNICDGIAGLADHPGLEPVEVTVSLWPTAYLFRKGHRIRVQVSSGSYPRYAANPGTGEPRGSAERLLVADQQVWHDAAHPSAVVLPVLKAHTYRLT